MARTTQFPDLITPVEIADLFHDVYQKTFLHLRNQISHSECLFGWDALAGILEQRWIDYPRLRLIRSGQLLDPSTYIEYAPGRRGAIIPRPRLETISRELKRGAMLHLASVEELHPPVYELAKKFQEALGGEVFVNAHLGMRASEGFDVHWDGHEVFVLQVHGRKAWKIFGVTATAPLAVRPELKQGAPKEAIWSGTLEVGDILYMPRGVWHAARALPDEATIHLTVGVVNPNAFDFLGSLRTLAGSEVMRRDIPPTEDREGFAKYVSELQNVLAKCLTEDMIRSYQSCFSQRSKRVATLDLNGEGDER